MPTGTVTTTISVPGINVNSSVQKVADGQISQEVSLVAGEAGSLTTRTDNTSGQITLTSAPVNIQTGDTINVYWTGGSRYGVTVGTVAGSVVPISGGAGDNLPAQDTAVIVGEVVEINLDVPGDDIALIFVHCTQKSHVNFTDNSDSSLFETDLSQNVVWSWVSDQGVTNPLASAAIGKVKVANGGTSAATVKIGIIYDSII